MSLQGKVALITGAAQGLGKVFSRALLQRGAKVCMSDINDRVGGETSEEFKQQFGKDAVIFRKCDVTSSEELEALFSQTKQTFGRLDIVCNNAGIVDEVDWRKSLAVNLTAVIQGTMLGMEHMRRDLGNHGGVIVNVASVAALYHVPYAPVYAAAKSGVAGLSKSWGCNPDFLAQGVRVNCLCPAYTRTPIIEMTNKIYSPHLAEANIKALGMMEPTDLLKGFLMLVEEDELTAAVLRVTRQGNKFVDRGLPDWLKSHV